MKYVYIEESGYEEVLSVETEAQALERAHELLRTGNYDGPCRARASVNVFDDDGDQVDLLDVVEDIPAPEPPCVEGHEHDWQSPVSVVGGIKENPGVWGHGGGVIIREACSHCGYFRVTDTWAQDPETGEEGLREVSYEEPDEASLAWAQSN